MSSVTYRALGPDTAVAAGAAEELVVDLRPFSDWNMPSTGVFRLVDGVPVELLGSDGGEPEDQTLGRRWSWVPGALTMAYDFGRTEQRIELMNELDGLMQDCAQAQYDDHEMNADGCGVNPYEAASPLEVVARVLGMKGPRARLDALYDAGAE